MSFLTAQDGTKIYYKDWGTGVPVVFSHGWPLSSDAFEDQMFFLSQRGYRCIAHDRRGFGRSDQPGDGNDMDSYAADLAMVIEELGLRKVTLVGHSMGGGEVVRYLSRYGSGKVSKAVLIAAVCPLMVQTPENPQGTPREVFDEMRTSIVEDRAQFFQDFTLKFYGFNLLGSKTSQGVRDAFWAQAMRTSLPLCYSCIEAFSETDFTEDLTKLDIPVLLLHGEADQIVPLAASSGRSAELIPDNQLKVYPGLSHGLCSTHKDQINADLLSFLQN